MLQHRFDHGRTNDGAPRHLCQNPRSAQSLPPYHHRVRAVFRLDKVRIRFGFDVAVRHDGDGNGALQFTERAPVRFAAVLLFARAGVQNHCGRPRLLHALAEIGKVFRFFVPAQAELDRHGHFDRVDDGAHDFFGKLLVPHQARSAARFGDFIDGTAHIQINERRVPFGDSRRRRHRVGIPPLQLNGNRRVRFVGHRHFRRAFVRAGKRIRQNHFGKQQLAAEFPHHRAKRSIRHTRHRRQHDIRKTPIF